VKVLFVVLLIITVLGLIFAHWLTLFALVILGGPAVYHWIQEEKRKA
jgi:hypothetical protein